MALYLAHGEVEATVGQRAVIVDRDDAWVLELSGDLGLLGEPRRVLIGVVAVAAHDLQRHVAPEHPVPHPVDLAHPPSPEEAQRDIAALRPEVGRAFEARFGSRGHARSCSADPRVGATPVADFEAVAFALFW